MGLNLLDSRTAIPFASGIALALAFFSTPVFAAEDQTKTKIFDPCTKLLVDVLPAPADKPAALDSVKDRDPNLYNQIQAKVADPRYIGELGNITVSTHDKDGNVCGCGLAQFRSACKSRQIKSRIWQCN